MNTIPQTTLNELREGFKLIREGLLAISHASGALEAQMVNMIEAQYEAGDYPITQATNTEAKQPPERQDPKPTEHTPEPVESDPEPTKDTTDSPEQKQAEGVSFVQLRTKLSELAKAGHRQSVKQLLTDAGYSKLSAVPEEAYQTIFDAAEAIDTQQAA